MNENLNLNSLDILKDSREFSAQFDTASMSNNEAETREPLDYILYKIGDADIETIHVHYEHNRLVITTKYNDHKDLVYYGDVDMFSVEDYRLLCKELGVNNDEKWNCSTTQNFNGVLTRIYANMPPLVDAPMLTISTTKTPPSSWSQGTMYEDFFRDTLIKSRFLIMGISGGGKTYLMNYLISRYSDPSEALGFIEEFGELIPPNDTVLTIRVPPPKPGEEHKLGFITSQSNLMRLDSLFVGELKGAEAWPFLLNLSSGTRGAATMHGNSIRDGLRRLSSLCCTSAVSSSTVDDFIAKALDYVVLVENHRITDVQRVKGTHNNGNFQLEEVNLGGESQRPMRVNGSLSSRRL